MRTLTALAVVVALAGVPGTSAAAVEAMRPTAPRADRATRLSTALEVAHAQRARLTGKLETIDKSHKMVSGWLGQSKSRTKTYVASLDESNGKGLVFWKRMVKTYFGEPTWDQVLIDRERATQRTLRADVKRITVERATTTAELQHVDRHIDSMAHHLTLLRSTAAP